MPKRSHAGTPLDLEPNRHDLKVLASMHRAKHEIAEHLIALATPVHRNPGVLLPSVPATVLAHRAPGVARIRSVDPDPMVDPDPTVLPDAARLPTPITVQNGVPIQTAGPDQAPALTTGPDTSKRVVVRSLILAMNTSSVYTPNVSVSSENGLNTNAP